MPMGRPNCKLIDSELLLRLEFGWLSSPVADISPPLCGHR
jgi:hypothetical protein